LTDSSRRSYAVGHESAADADSGGGRGGREFIAGVRARLGAELRAARLFGSRARGEGDEHSDLDIALIVAPGVRARRYEIYDLAFDVGLAHGVELAPLVLEESRFDELKARELRIAQAIGDEGIAL